MSECSQTATRSGARRQVCLRLIQHEATCVAEFLAVRRQLPERSQILIAAAFTQRRPVLFAPRASAIVGFLASFAKIGAKTAKFLVAGPPGGHIPVGPVGRSLLGAVLLAGSYYGDHKLQRVYWRHRHD